MYKVSYETCVCFIFLVVLAVLSCSGFRIDNLAMTDISKRNFRGASSSSLGGDRTFNPTMFLHRMRHQRQLRSQAQHYLRQNEPHKPSGHIEAHVFPPRYNPLHPTTQPSLELHAQIPPTDNIHQFLPPTRSIVTRDTRKARKMQQQQQCHKDEDLLKKAYRAKIVLHAKAESTSRRVDPVYTVHFKIVKQLKNSSYPIHDHIRLKFSNSSTSRCDNDDSKFLAADIQTSQEYVLFLNASGPYRYWPSAAPEKIKKIPKKKLNKLKQVCNPNFKPTRTEIKVVRRAEVRKGGGNSGAAANVLKLVCRARGFPPPRITWRRRGTTLRAGPHVQIRYRRRGQRERGRRGGARVASSVLVVKNDGPVDGPYECVAKSALDDRPVTQLVYVTGTQQSTTTQPTPFSEIYSKTPCDNEFGTAYCLNGGKCFMDTDPHEKYCECPNGYGGPRCGEKKVYQPSMYPQPDIYTCKLGLSTKYFC